ncbi:MAG: PqqD family protein [Pyrinomonadaceae bacterium]
MTIHSSDQSPRARKDRLIIKDLPDETLVYDLENDKAHCLNVTSALVWKHCDGHNSVSDISQILAEETKTKANDNIVWLALDQLEKFNLLTEGLATPAHFAGMSRRQWVRNVGFAAIALPIIASIAAPTAQAQGSCVNAGGRAPGVACGSPNQCCTNVCCNTSAGNCPVGNPNNTCL